MNRTVGYWDTSALVPLCTRQARSPEAESLAEKYLAIVWWASSVEINSAIARLARSREIDQVEVRIALDRLDTISAGWREILPSEEVKDHAQWLLYTYPLRAADSLQLAAAMVWCRNKPSGRTFICSDVRLGEAAAQAGFTVLHP